MSKSTVLTLVGSLRAESTNQKLAEVHPKDDAKVVEQIKGVFAVIEEARTVAAA